MADQSKDGAKTQAAAAHHTEEEIRQRAHEIYLRRGGRDGSAEEDWRQAEAELRQKDSEQS